jgi:2-polyprenyl-6-methoxyphenol hydroxylase-like FAD-dependent oxidoreductase
MERQIKASEYCTLRRGCTVVGQDVLKDNGVVVRYVDPSGCEQAVRCSWLFGADGRKGVVRKHFLERQAGIRHAPAHRSSSGEQS